MHTYESLVDAFSGYPRKMFFSHYSDNLCNGRFLQVHPNVWKTSAENDRLLCPGRSVPSPHASCHYQGPQNEKEKKDNVNRCFELGGIVSVCVKIFQSGVSHIAAPQFVLPSKRLSSLAKAPALILPVGVRG